MGFLVFLLIAAGVAGIVGLVIYFSVVSAKKRRASWMYAAQRLNFRFTPDVSVFQPGKINGEVDGVKVSVDIHYQGSGKSRTAYTRYKVSYPSLGLGLRLSRQGFLQEFSRLLGAQDIEIGDGSFDRGVIVKGDDPDKIRDFLNFKRRSLVSTLILDYPQVVIDDHQVLHKTVGLEGRRSVLMATINRMIEMGVAMGGSPEVYPEEEDRPKMPPGGLIGLEPEGPTVEEEVPEIEDKVDESQDEPAPEPELEELESPVETEAAEDVKQVEVESVTEEAPEEPTDLPSLDVEQVCDLLLKDSPSSLEMEKRFAEVAGKTVKWQGKLLSSRNYSTDYVFGQESGTRAEFEIFQLESSYGFKSRVKAVVKLPESANEELKSAAGKDFSFSGKLLKAEGIAREIFVTDGVVVVVNDD